jgi:hypothetical protein
MGDSATPQQLVGNGKAPVCGQSISDVRNIGFALGCLSPLILAVGVVADGWRIGVCFRMLEP